MTVKVLVNSAESVEKAALSYASRVAKRLHSDLLVFSAMPRPETLMVYAGFDGAVAVTNGTVDAARAEQATRRDAIKTAYDAVLSDEALPAETASLHHLTDFPAFQAARAGIVGGPLILPRSANGEDHELAEALRRVLMEARLPVVLAAKDAPSLKTALIAWDGSAEASRAVRFHIDLIKAHDRVIIAQNPDDISLAGDHSDPAQLQAWLKAQQVHADVVTFSGKVAGGLTELAEKESADLIVAGAYGHSRIGEFLFGGATRGLLKSETGPALALAH